MFKNNLKIAFRYFAKHKGYTLINTIGLAVGIACCIFIMQFVKSEWSFDKFHTKSDRIYRAWLEEHYQGEIFQNTTTPIPLGPVLRTGVPDIEATCRVASISPTIRLNNNTFIDPVVIVDSNFFDIFDFDLKEGNVKNVFTTKNSVVITETIAEKYFGKNEAVGKDMELLLGRDTVRFTVTGIAKDPVLESTIQFGLIIPFSNAPHLWSEDIRTNAWSNVSTDTYALLKEGASVDAVNKKIATVMDPLVAKNYKPGEYLVLMQPITDIHFNSTLPDDIAKPSDPKYAYILGCIGVLILLIACINFVTLSVGRSTTRALEVGVRKVLGAERKQLIGQFWGEALLLTVFATVIGVSLAALFQSSFNELANRQLSLRADAATIIFFIVMLALIGLLAGIYPAFILSSFRPIEVLKGKLSTGDNIGLFRKGLIVLQFVASIVMIIGTFSIGKQLNYLRSKDLGYEKDQVIVVRTNRNIRIGTQLANLMKTEIQKDPKVLSASVSLYSMAEAGWLNLGYVDEQKVFRSFKFNTVDADFVNTMNFTMAAGRAFSKTNAADSNYVLVNEAYVKTFGIKDPIGKKMHGKYDERILGVVKDFHLESLRSPIVPAVMALKGDSIFSRSSDISYQLSPRPRLSVRFAKGDLQANVASLQTAWKKVAGDQDFEFRFLDDALNTAYEQEIRLGRIAKYTSFLSIFIACMGLFGLSTLIVVRRTKEIGIRKVLGANVTSIITLISKEFFVLVTIASLIAFPLAWWGLSKWLQDFAYRIDVPWLAFIASALLVLTIALITVGIQAFKAALVNPVKSLKTE